MNDLSPLSEDFASTQDLVCQNGIAIIQTENMAKKKKAGTQTRKTAKKRTSKRSAKPKRVTRKKKTTSPSKKVLEPEILPKLPSAKGPSSPDWVPTLPVSASDPLRAYLESIKHYPLLDPEEEIRLAKKLQEEGDLEAAKTLVTANLRLVVKIAFEYQNMYNNVLDLIQEGNIGLMKAVSKFDPSKGARLGYYATWWIRSYILKYLLDNFRLVKIGKTQAQKKLFYHLMREKEKLEAQGLLAGPKLLAERLDVREKDVVEMEQRLSGSGAEVSLDSPVKGTDGTITHLDHMADDSDRVDEQIAKKQLIGLLMSRIPEFEKTLNEKESQVLNERLLAEKPKTLQEVADDYGLTRERVRQIEARLIQKLREFLKGSLTER